MNTRLVLTASLFPLAAAAALMAPMLAPTAAPDPVTPPPPEAPVAPATPPEAPPAPVAVVDDADGVHVTATPDRTVVYAGDGELRVRLDWWADAAPDGQAPRWPTDLVVVLDRSGSMAGDKLADAKRAALGLLGQLDDGDRFTLVSFAGDVRVDVPSVPALAGQQRAMLAVHALQAAGGTDMRAGLVEGLAATAPEAGRIARMVLISDGHPNDRTGLRELAAAVLRADSSLTAIGIGADYDEMLLQSLADAGGGTFHWARQGGELEQVLVHQLAAARRTVASAGRLRSTGSARIVDAGGLVPGADGAVDVGSLQAGQRRSLWVTLEVPRGSGGVDPGALELSLVAADGRALHLVADLPEVAVTEDAAVAYASLGDAWAESVVVDRYNAMRTEVSAAVQRGDQGAALAAIEAYRVRNFAANRFAGNATVAENLRQLDTLVHEVNANFQGPRARERQNLWSKGTRSDAYGKRRIGSVIPVPAPAPR